MYDQPYWQSNSPTGLSLCKHNWSMYILTMIGLKWMPSDAQTEPGIYVFSKIHKFRHPWLIIETGFYSEKAHIK